MRKRIVSCAMAFLMVFTLMPCSAFAGEASAEGQAESLEAERPAEDDAFGEGGLDEAFFAEDADSLIGTLEADEESAAFAVSAVTGIYLDQTHGNDANDGLTKDTAVRTLEKANELANANGTRDIFLASVYQVTGTENWDLGGKTIHRYKLGGYMIELKDASASLTLKDVVIDGAEYSVAAENAAETDSIIKAASGGTIELKSGAILENNKAAQFGSGILAINGVEITMEDGAVIRNNTNRNYELGGGILLGNGSTFTMNGGEISGNTANGGGGVAIIGSTMVMNGGTISNNSTYKTSGQGSYGAGVYVADYANASGGNILFKPKPASFEMNGGKITGNTALDYGGGILTFPQQGEKITININKNGEISENQVTKGSGGAIAAFFGVTELNVNGGTLTKNSAKNYGGGVFLYDATNVTISGGTISENKASQGGGVYLWPTSAANQTGGSIENNVANAGGGVCGGTYTMTGGVIKDNNNSLTEEARRSTRGDGVYVGTAFNLGGAAEISTNNDVYLEKGAREAKEGRYINVISSYTGASTAKPIQIHSEDKTVEGTEIGTQLVRYTTGAGGEAAAIFFRLLKDDVRDDNLTANSVFTDVAFGKWYNKSISTMAKIGIVKGRTANTFAPNAPITRAEFAAICSRFDRSNVEIKSDFNDISGHWAENEIRRAASLGWIQGYTDGSFKPDQNITRAEAASMINRMLHRLPETVDDLLDGMIQWPDNQPSDWYYINMQEATNSHDFKQKGEINEHWTKLTENPNWDRYK